jgi:two-component system response regulator AtoC
MHHALSDVRSTPAWDRRRPLEFVRSLSPAMKATEIVISNVASSMVPVLIIGECGTGKRTLAFRLHELSKGKREKIEEVACRDMRADALPVLTSGGHGPGATSTLLLTEIAELPAACQPVLLNLLLQREASEEGSGPRLVVSTHRNLEEEIGAGHFREDLYYRLAGVCLRIPPLRHRREDVPALADFFLRKYSALFGRPAPVLGDSTRRFLAEYSWPGNVTELEAAIKTIAAIGDDRIAMKAFRSSSMNGAGNQYEAGTSLKEASRAASRQAERELILRVLSRTHWNRKRAAEELRISYKALLYKLKQIGVDDCTKSLTQGEDE